MRFVVVVGRIQFLCFARFHCGIEFTHGLNEILFRHASLFGSFLNRVGFNHFKTESCEAFDRVRENLCVLISVSTNQHEAAVVLGSLGDGFCFRNLQPGFGNKSFAFRIHLNAVASMHERGRIAVTRRCDGTRIELIHIDEQRLNLFGHQNVLARNPWRTAYDEARCPGTDVFVDHRFVCAVSARGEDDAAAGQIVFSAFGGNAGHTFDIEALVLDE